MMYMRSYVLVHRYACLQMILDDTVFQMLLTVYHLLNELRGILYYILLYYTQFIYSNRDVYIAIALCSKLLYSALLY
jgi:hypothetical protein